MTKFLLKTTAKAVELAATLLLHNFQGFNIIINKDWVFCTYKLESLVHINMSSIADEL